MATKRDEGLLSSGRSREGVRSKRLRRGAPMVNTDTFVPEEQHFILSSLSPGRAQKWLALLVAFLMTAGPLSTIELARIDAFPPLYATALFVTDLMTAVLLFAQLSILPSRA